MTHQGKVRGFTLVELLVVVAIIATLMAILMPALRKAASAATSIDCMVHLRQLAMMGTFYGQDNRGILPYNSLADSHSPPYYYNEYPLLNADGSTAGLQQWYARAPFSQYLTNAYYSSMNSPLHCPLARKLFAGKGFTHYTRGSSYGLGNSLGGKANADRTLPRTSWLDSTTVWWGDAGPGSWNPTWASPPGMYFNQPYLAMGKGGTPWPWYWYNYFDGHPNHSANVIYGDIHTENKTLPADKLYDTGWVLP